MRLHAIILALNEEPFIKVQLDTIYPYCSAISVITQYDRDWYGKGVTPDKTTSIVKHYPDPEGKVNLVIRRMPDEAAARNMEMLSFNRKAFKSIMSHGSEVDKISSFHSPPDYYWIIDADEIYDTASIPKIIDHLERRKPRGLRVWGINYIKDWNHYVPREVIPFCHFGFLRPGVLFEMQRVVSWNQQRMAKLFRLLRLPDWSNKLYRFETCPFEVGYFHHGCWIGSEERLRQKFLKSSHLESHSIDPLKFHVEGEAFIATENLPLNIQRANWPKGFINNAV